MPPKAKLHVAILTTSFPLTRGETGGVFIKHLIEAMPDWIMPIVVTPAPGYAAKPPDGQKYPWVLFRYGPVRMQTLAHNPGGIPAALSRSLFPFVLLPSFMAAMFLACLRVARRADVIHANWSVNGVIAGIAGMVSGKPVITTLRGTDISSAKRSKVFSLALKLCMRTSDKVVAVSQTMQHALGHEFPQYRDKVFFIPNGVGDAFLSVERNNHCLGKNILAIGNLTSNKNIQCILSAIKQLADEYDLCLEIIGDGPERSRLEAFSMEQRISNRVRFTGPMEQAEIPKALQKGDIFVLASFSEGRPNVLVEAMATGMPIVASNIDGVRELITDGTNGLLFDPRDSMQLAEQIRRLCENPELRSKLAHNARQYVIENGLSWTQAAQHYASLYESAVSTH